MPELLLVNPRRRSRKKAAKRGKKRTRSAAQKAATARMLAANRAKRGGSKKRRARRAKSSTVTGVAIMRKTRRVRRGRKSAARRRNPINLGAMTRKPLAMLTPALIGAVGAVGVNTFMSRVVPRILPANMQATFMTGRVRYVTQALAAVALGMAAQKVGVKAATAAKMAEGSLTVTLADAIRDFAGQAGIQLGGMGYYLPGRRASPPYSGASAAPQVGRASAMNGMGLYVSGPGAGSNVTPMKRRSGMGFGVGRTF